MNQILPQHIAIVMDGNGRWAESRGLMRIEGHKAGVLAVKTIIRCCLQSNIPILSLFAFSSENWSRPENEVEFLMQLFIEALNTELAELHQHGIALRFTGDRTGLSAKLCQEMLKAENFTKNNQKLTLNIAVNYGGKWDIIKATKTLVKRVVDGELALHSLSEADFTNALDTAGLPDPDLFIRTSGEQRISNFFLWQLAYTELYFTEKTWPEFDRAEFQKALDSFSQRERRYGKLSPQLKEVSHV